MLSFVMCNIEIICYLLVCLTFFCVRFVRGQPLPSISLSNVPKSSIPRKKDMQVVNRLVIVTSYTFTLIDLYTFQIETNIFF
jgi:hypothetical protein